MSYLRVILQYSQVHVGHIHYLVSQEQLLMKIKIKPAFIFKGLAKNTFAPPQNNRYQMELDEKNKVKQNSKKQSWLDAGICFTSLATLSTASSTTSHSISRSMIKEQSRCYLQYKKCRTT